MLHQPLGVDPARIGDEAEVVQRLSQALGIVAARRVDSALLELDLLRAESLGHAEVEKRDPPVVHEDVVAGVVSALKCCRW